MERFTPEIIEEADKQSGRSSYGTMLVELKNCPICGHYMIRPPGDRWHSPFPRYYAIDFKAQLAEAKWVEKSDVRVDGKKICVPCAEAGRADFLCALCGQRRPTNEIEDHFGEPPEFLCKPCYRTVPAETWNKKLSKLSESHRYDFE